MKDNIKKIAALVAGLGVTTICGGACKLFLTGTSNPISKLSAGFAGLIVTCMVDEKVCEYIDNKVEKYASELKKEEPDEQDI